VRTIPDTTIPQLTSVNNELDLGTGILTLRFDETLDTSVGSGGSHQMRAVNLANIFLVNAPDSVIDLAGALTLTSLEDNRALRILLNETQRVFAIESSASTVRGGDSIIMTLSIQADAVTDIAGNGNALQESVTLIEIVDAILPTFGAPATIDLNAGEIVLTASETMDLSGATSDAVYVDSSKYDLSLISLTDNSNTNNPNNIPSMNSRSMSLQGAQVLARTNLGAPLTITIRLTEIQRVAAVEASSNLPRLGQAITLTIAAGVAKDVSLLLSTTADAGITPDTVTLQETPDTVAPTLLSGVIDYSTGLLTVTTSEMLGGASGTPLETLAIGRYAVPSLLDADGDGDLDLFVGIERGEIVYLENRGTSSVPFFQHETAKTLANNQVVDGFFSSGASLTSATKAASGFASVTFLNLDGPIDSDLDLVMGESDGSLRYFQNDGNNVFTELTTTCANAPPNAQTNCYPFTFQTKVGLEYATVATATNQGIASYYIGTASGYIKYIHNGGSGVDPILYDHTQPLSVNNNKLSAPDVGDRAAVCAGNLYQVACASDELCREDVLVGTAAGLIVTYRIDNSNTVHTMTGAANPARNVDVSTRGGYAAPALADLDGDSDLDLIVGAADGTLHYYENTGTTTSPDFTSRDPIVYDQTPLNQQSPFTGLSLTRISLDDNTAPSTAGPKIEITVSSAIPVSQYYNELNITLTKTLLSQAILISGTPGGDGGAAYLRIAPLGVRDVALNYISSELSVLLTEIPDTIPPYLISAEVFYSRGILHIVLDEYIGYNVSAGNNPEYAMVNLTALSLSDHSGARHVPLTGAYIQPEVNTSLYITLTEEQRVDAIEFSGTPGGDGHSVYLDILAGGLTDLAGNSILATLNVTVSEAADVLVPILLSGRLEYATGILEITAQETIDASSVDTSKIFISDIAGQRNIQLTGTSLIEVLDGFTVRIQITEAMRANSISISGLEGGNLDGNGDLQPVVLDFDAGALKDIAQSNNEVQDGVSVVEVADKTPPVVLSGSIDYNNGNIRIVSSETIDATPPLWYKVVDLTKILLVNAPTWDYATNSHSEGEFIYLTGANVTLTDGETITIRLTEAQRALAVTFSNTPGGGGTGATGDAEPIHLTILPGAIRDVANNTNNETFNNQSITETADTTQPEILAQAIDYGLGRITLKFTETIDVTPPTLTTDLTQVRLDNTSETSEPGAQFLQHLYPTDITMQTRFQFAEVDGTTVVLSLSEAERTSLISYSGTTGGDSPNFVSKIVVDPFSAIFIDILAGSFRDRSGNLVVPSTNLQLVETPDNSGPRFADSGPQLLNFNDGTLIIYAHKTLELAPLLSATDPIDLTKMYLSNSSTSDDVQLTGATVVSNVDDMSLTITLTEAQRVAVLFWSNTPGGGGTFSLGDTHSVVLNLKYGALMDTARNLNNESLGLAIIETADTRRPNVLSVTVDFNDGAIRITSDEIMDVTPHLDTVINLQHIILSNITRGFTREWTMVITAQGITEEQSVVVTQGSAVGFLNYKRQHQWTFSVSGTNGVTESAGVSVTQGSNVGTLAIALENYWTLDVNSAVIVEAQGSTVVQGSSTGTLRHALVGVGTTSIVVTAASGVTFDDSTDLVLNSGSTTVLGTDITAITHTGRVSSIKVKVASGVTLDTSADLVIGGTTVTASDLTSPTDTGSTTTLQINTYTTQTFDASTNLLVGATTVTAANIQSATENTVAGGFFDNPPAADFVYKATEFDLRGAEVVQTDGLTITVIMTEKQRSSAIQLSGTPGGDTYGMSTTLLSLANGALSDMANNSNMEIMDVQITETADTTAPSFLGASIQFGTGLLRLNASEIIDLTPTSGVDLTKIFLVDTHEPSNTFTLQLTGATVTNSEDAEHINILLTEEQRTAAILQSGVPGGDLYSLYLQVQAGGVSDVAGNPSIAIDNILLVEVADAIPPKFTSGVLDFNTGTGVLTLQADEFIDLTEGSTGTPGFGFVDLSKLFLTNEASGTDISLQDATVAPVDFNLRSHALIIQMTEAQRAAAVALSGTPGGDGTALFAHVQDDMLTGFGTQGNALNGSVELSEIADTTPPTLTLTALDLSTGVLTLTGSETIDATPSNLVDPSLLTLVQATGSATDPVNLAGAIVNSVDGLTIDVTLTETQRVNAIAISGTPGGDGGAMRIDCGAGAVRDVATNPSTLSNDVQVDESPDIVVPTISNVTFDFNNRQIVIFISETVKMTSITDQTKFVVADVSNVHNNVNTHVPITGATLENVADGTSITFTLTESQKVAIQKFSGTPGGDNTYSVLDVSTTAFSDVALNAVDVTFNTRIYEIPDTTKPTITSATIDYGLSTLTIIMDEFISAMRPDGTSLVTLANFVFRDVHTMMDRYDFNIKTRFVSADDPSTFDMLDANVRHVESHLTTTIVFDLAERTRVALVQMSGVPGGDRYPIVPDGSIASHVCSDSTVRIAAVTAGFQRACEEPASKTGAPSEDAVQNAYYDPGAVIVDIITGGLVDVANNSNAEITDCRERDTTDQSVFITVTSCPAPSARGMVLVEIPDTVRPNISAIAVDFALGEVRLTATETMDASPAEDLVLSGLFLGNEIGGLDVPLIGASVALQVAQTLTIRLTEVQRIAAMSIAGTPGGDGEKLTFTVRNDFSVRDMSSNFMFAANISGDAVTEIADTLGPLVSSCLVYLGNGTIIFTAVETVDVYPKSDVHVELMSIRGDSSHALGEGSAGYTGGGNITLNGASVLTEM
jgi:hypothetical protein